MDTNYQREFEPSKPDAMSAKWSWCMNYCQRNRLAPANAKCWQEALDEYDKFERTGGLNA